MIKKTIIFIYLLFLIRTKKNFKDIEKEKKHATTFKISENLIDKDNIKALTLKSGTCSYNLNLKLKSFQIIQEGNSIKVSYTIVLEEKLKTKHRNPKTNHHIKIKSTKTEKKFITKQKLKINDLEKLDLDSVQIKIFIKDIFWKYDSDQVKEIKKPKYLFIKIDKTQKEQMGEEAYEFIGVPCDTKIPNVKLIKDSLDYTDAQERFLGIFNKDIEILDLDLDFEVSVLKKIHLDLKRDQIKHFFCSKFNFERLKFRSMKYRLKICED